MHPHRYMLMRAFNARTFEHNKDQGHEPNGGKPNDDDNGDKPNDDDNGDDDNGDGDDDDPAPNDNGGQIPGDDDDDDAGDEDKDKKAKLSDEAAKLLREQMQTKAKLRKAQKDLKDAQAALAAYRGVDPEKVAKLVQKEQEAERKELEARGEYERILKQVNEQHEAAIVEKDNELKSVRDELAQAQAQIDELTIGNAFATSKFLREETVLSPAKARKLYGDHVERVEGEIVVYDKPKGAANRTPLVDAQGNNLSFEEAIAKIVKADPDFEGFARSKLKPGGGSTGVQHKPGETPKQSNVSGVDRIAANLGKLAVMADPTGKAK